MEDDLDRDVQAPLLKDQDPHRKTSGVLPRRPIRRENTDDLSRTSGSEDEFSSSPKSADEILEMDDINSDAGNEEAGLTAKERRRRNTVQQRLQSHETSHVLLSKYDRQQADRVVVRKLIVNAVLIGLWYIFATSISVVSWFR